MFSILENIAEHGPEGSMVTIIMDAEIIWTYFPENGYHFLSAFFKRLAEHLNIELTTFSECLAAKVEVKQLEKLIAGGSVIITLTRW
jgi:alpha-amylase/alpha-mannosidase (GH57 family)